MTWITRPSLTMSRFRLTRATLVLLLPLSVTAGYLLQISVRHYHTSTLYQPFGDTNANALRRHQTDHQWPWLSYSSQDGVKRHMTEAVKGFEVLVNERDEETLHFGDDGLVRGWEDPTAGKAQGWIKGSKRVRHSHPIHDLIKLGNERWASLLDRQSKTLPQAVIEYQRRYGRSPPRGFEQWWRYTRRNNVKIVDDYDQIDRDISPYFALSPQMFRERVEKLESEPHSYKITLDPHGPSSLSGNRSTADRPRLLFRLLEPIAQYLSEAVFFQGSDHDVGSWLLGDDQKQAALQAIKENRYLTAEEIKKYQKREGRGPVKGLVAACPVGSSAWIQSLALQAGQDETPPGQVATFVHDPLATYDFCSIPSHLQSHGSFSFDFSRESQLRPLFQWSKHLRNPEFLATPLEAYENHTSLHAQDKYTPWSEKVDNRVFWRGSATGDFYRKEKYGKISDWRKSHRPRLGLMAQAKEGTKKVWMQRGKAWHLEEWGVGKLNQVYLDVGLTGRPHQVSHYPRAISSTAKALPGARSIPPPELTTSVRTKMGHAARWQLRSPSSTVLNQKSRPNSSVGDRSCAKVIEVPDGSDALDVDGNGWSSRFHRLMMSGSVVVKSTIFPEWISDWLIPWVHYVPIQVDYSDLYNTMSFFTGPPNISRKGGGGNDHLARAIAEQARKFGEEHWRWEDMQGYMFRLLLEVPLDATRKRYRGTGVMWGGAKGRYLRLMADDRDAASYQR